MLLTQSHAPNRISALIAALAIVTFSEVVRATPSVADKSRATELFREGRELLVSGKVVEACAAFEESEALDPAPGTSLNLAVCHEQQGRTATAWAEFKAALAQAERDGRDDRIALAREHVKALEPRLSKLIISVSPEADLAGLQIRRDGELVPRAAWGKPQPLDIGKHEIVAFAPGKLQWATRVDIALDANLLTLQVPVLDGATHAEPKRVESHAEQPALQSGASRTVESRAAVKEERAPSPVNVVRVLAVSSFAVGVVGVGVGAAFGVRALGKRTESNDECPHGKCTWAGVELNQSAKRAADVSTVAFALGGAALAAGAYLWFSSGASTTRVVARLAPGGGGLQLDQAF